MLPLNTTEILKKLDKKELKRFGDFIKTPYFNSIEKLCKLYDEVVKVYPDFESERLDYEKIHKKLYPGKEYKLQEIKNLYSEFGSILRKFITYEEISLDEDILDFYLVKALTRKKSFELSNKVINEKRKRKNDTERIGHNYYLYNYNLETAYHTNLLFVNNRERDNVYQRSKNAANYFIVYFLHEFLAMSYELSFSTYSINLQDTGNEIAKRFVGYIDFKDFFDYLETTDIQNTASIRLKYMLYYYISNDITEDDFMTAKEFLLNNIDTIPHEDVFQFWGAIQDIFYLKLVPKDTKYYRTLFELNDFFAKLKLYPSNKLPPIQPPVVRDIMTTAHILKEYEWAENFLKEFINYMPEEVRDNVMNYHMGMLSFKYKRYKESLEYFNKVVYTDIFEKLNVRFYYLMNYVELKLYDSALALINSIREFHRKNKEIPEVRSNLHKDSLRFFTEIIKAEETNSKLDYSIYKEAQSITRYSHRQYILEKMEKMI